MACYAWISQMHYKDFFNLTAEALMKVEIDLNDILGDEEGAETLSESVRRQVIDSIKAQIKSETSRKIDEAVSLTISQAINDYLKTEMPVLLAGIMDAPFTPISSYGQRGEPTNFRKELVRVFSENMQYKKTSSSYDRNAFTKAIDEMVEVECKKFQKDFNTKVDATFTSSCMEYATNALKRKLGIAA